MVNIVFVSNILLGIIVYIISKHIPDKMPIILGILTILILCKWTTE